MNAIGYAVLGVVGLICFFQMRGRGFVTFDSYDWRWAKIRKRFCRPLPILLLVVTALVFLGGAIHPPSNHTGLSYRIPRVLHCLDANQWHWIKVEDWMTAVRAEVVTNTTATIAVSAGPQKWYVVKMKK